MTGQALGHYQILEKIGAGGMGEVYKARDTRLNRVVAIKVLPPARVADPARKRRFIQEAQAASALNHPNIVVIHDINSSDGVDYMVMEYIPGKTLDAVIPKTGIRLGEALKAATQIADGLSKAHAASIVHRDLKPSNVMMSDDGRIKILDFGLAKLTDRLETGPDDNTRTQRPDTEEGTILGTVAYMSPEQAEGKPVDARSDIFSFGALLYEMLTGRRAFARDSRISTMSAILKEEPKTVEGVPPEADRILRRCLRKDPAKRFQHMDDLKVALEELREKSESGTGLSEPAVAIKAATLSHTARWLIGGTVALAGIAAAVMFFKPSAPPPPASAPSQALSRVTSDAGLTSDPDVTPDGKLLAYASDRAGGEDRDIWVQHLGGGAPVRLTKDPADESEPSIAPDGSRVAFRSEKDGGGIYEVPVLGGEPRLIVKGGSKPRYSPDGARIAFQVVSAGAAGGTAGARVFVAAASGGSPKPLAPEFAHAVSPVWSPDGKRILFTGRPGRSDFNATDWWVVPGEGGAPVATGVLSVLQKERIFGIPEAWRGRFVYFTRRGLENANLWRMPLTPQGAADGKLERVTFGTATEAHASLTTDGRLFFSSLAESSNLGYFPIDVNSGKLLGERVKITAGSARNVQPSISHDGNHLVYGSTQGGRPNVWYRDLTSGKERNLTAGRKGFPAWGAISGDGQVVTFGARRQTDVVRVRLAGGDEEELAPKYGNWKMSTHGDLALVSTVRTPQRPALNLAVARTAGQTPVDVLVHPKWDILSPEFSPDDKWIAFHARNSEMTRQMFIAPYREGAATPETEWIPVSDGKELDRDPQWSPDGKLIYFQSDRDGARCLFVQRLDPATKRPAGAATALAHFHSARSSMKLFTNTGEAGPAIGAGKLVFGLAERTGNIWWTKVE